MPSVAHTNPRGRGESQLGANVHFPQVKGTHQQHEVISGTDGNTRAGVTIVSALDTSVYSSLMGWIYKNFSFNKA